MAKMATLDFFGCFHKHWDDLDDGLKRLVREAGGLQCQFDTLFNGKNTPSSGMHTALPALEHKTLKFYAAKIMLYVIILAYHEIAVILIKINIF